MDADADISYKNWHNDRCLKHQQQFRCKADGLSNLPPGRSAKTLRMSRTKNNCKCPWKAKVERRRLKCEIQQPFTEKVSD